MKKMMIVFSLFTITSMSLFADYNVNFVGQVKADKALKNSVKISVWKADKGGVWQKKNQAAYKEFTLTPGENIEVTLPEDIFWFNIAGAKVSYLARIIPSREIHRIVVGEVDAKKRFLGLVKAGKKVYFEAHGVNIITSGH
jgi:hypothetical protein